MQNICYIYRMNITKLDLVIEVSMATGVTQKDTKKVVECFLDSITNHLERGNTIEIRGFGRFAVKSRKERPVRNPRTGEQFQLEGRKVPTLKFYDELKERIDK